MMTITSMTRSAMLSSSVSQQSQLNESNTYLKENITPELKERLEQYGVSVYFSAEAENYLRRPEPLTQKEPSSISPWIATFQKLGLI